MRKCQQRCAVQFFVICSSAIYSEKDLEAAHKSRARCGFAAQMGHHAGDNDLLNISLSESFFKRCV